MTDEARTSTTDGAGAQNRFGNPLLRPAFLALFLITLPFTWGETASCNGSGRAFTGIEQATKDPGVAIGLCFVFVTPVLLGFVQHSVRQTWIRAILEFASVILSGVGTFYCFVATILSGIFSRGGDQIYPAPLFATVAAFMMTLHAFRGAVLRVSEMVTSRLTDNRRG